MVVERRTSTLNMLLPTLALPNPIQSVLHETLRRQRTTHIVHLRFVGHDKLRLEYAVYVQIKFVFRSSRVRGLVLLAEVFFDARKDARRVLLCTTKETGFLQPIVMIVTVRIIFWTPCILLRILLKLKLEQIQILFFLLF